MDYKNAGVDIEAGYKSVELMKQHIAKTMRPEVLGGIGGFSGAFSMNSFKDMEEPTLVSGTDGVGTKLKLAFIMDKHDTVGIDCVAMCVNDIACAGGEPLFFLDYIACGKNYPEKIAEIVKGVAEGCSQSSAALIGGETAEMPSFYDDDEYDMAGFAVGIVDKKKIIDGSKVAEGNVIIGLPSSGIHSNGYSLVRKVFFDKMNMDVADYVEELDDTLGGALITPTRIYVRPAKAVFEKYTVNGVVHITGGGFYENIPRILPDGLCAEITTGTWKVLPIFKYIKKCGNIEPREMFSTFNMGIGMMMVVDEKDAEGVMSILKAEGEDPSIIGRIVKGEGVTVIHDGKAL